MTIELATVDASRPGTPTTSDRILPDTLDGWALFLDIDGTLLDLALVPTEVVVPEWMPAALISLSRQTGGALALVTGRTLDDADALFMPTLFPLAGLHGADIRLPDGRMHKAPRSALLDPLRVELAAMSRLNPALIVEDKGAGLAIHYRLAPKFGDRLIERMTRFVETASDAFEVQHGKMVVEVRPAGTSKGTAVKAFLEQAPFAGRRPLAIGDDLTDEAMFAVVEACGGRAVRVGSPDRPTAASMEVDSADDIRGWIERMA